jgi:transcriptional regulator with XRE-family HTH domain
MRRAIDERLGRVLAEEVGRCVRRLRKQRKLTQLQLATRAGSYGPVIARLEKGAVEAPEIETLRGIARALCIDLRSLLLGLDWTRIDRVARASLHARPLARINEVRRGINEETTRRRPVDR